MKTVPLLWLICFIPCICGRNIYIETRRQTDMSPVTLTVNSSYEIELIYKDLDKFNVSYYDFYKSLNVYRLLCTFRENRHLTDDSPGLAQSRCTNSNLPTILNWVELNCAFKFWIKIELGFSLEISISRCKWQIQVTNDKRAFKKDNYNNLNTRSHLYQSTCKKKWK